MKRGFAPKIIRKEDITRDQRQNTKGLLTGLGVVTAVLGGITAGLYMIDNKRKGS